MSHTRIVTQHIAIRDYLSEYRLPLDFSKPLIAYIKTYMVAATVKGFRGKIFNLAEYSDCHRTSIAQKTKPSLQAQSPMESTSFHHSHLLSKVVFGYQLQTMFLSCADVSLIHLIDLYDKKTNAFVWQSCDGNRSGL